MTWPDAAAWTGPQWTFVIVSAVYVVLFALFCRLLVWKWQAERRHWRLRPSLSLADVSAAAARRRQPLPFVTLLIPARNEAAVIAATVRHMAALRYPKERLALIVITDAREDEAAAAERDEVVPAVARWLCECDRSGPPPGGRTAARVLAALLVHVLPTDACPAPPEGVNGARSPAPLPGDERRRLIADAALQLGSRPGAAVAQTSRRLRALLPAASASERAAQLGRILTSALAVHAARQQLYVPHKRAQLRRVAAIVADAQSEWTQDALVATAEAAAAAAIHRLTALRGAALDEALVTAYRVACPTTRDKVAEVATGLAGKGGPRLSVTTVPIDFDGRLGGVRTGQPVPSTKGRALNWGLAHVPPQTDWCGFFDAESRPDPDVLLYIASRHLAAGGTGPAIYQGPVFQVRNFFEMGPFSKIASLYQSVAHEWVLPALFRRLPFVGGTNLFIRPQLLWRIGGFDHELLTEDLELGTRAYLEAGEWPAYLPYPSSEQTPPTVGGYFRQRLRWGAGHLQVVRKVRESRQYEPRRRRRLLWQLWRKGQLDWLAAQLIVLVPPASIVLFAIGVLDPTPFGLGWRLVLHALTAVYFGFTFYTYHRYAVHMDGSARPPGLRGQIGPLLQLVLLPLAAFVFPAPYSTALVLSLIGAAPRRWFKTPRTPE